MEVGEGRMEREKEEYRVEMEGWWGRKREGGKGA